MNFGNLDSYHCYSFLTWCVNGFAFISGWFGIKFSFGKFFRLWIYAFICAFLSEWIFGYLMNPDNYQFSLVAIGLNALRRWRSYWYLVAYAILMLLAPYLNYLLKENACIEKWKFWIPFILLLSWSCLYDLQFNHAFSALIPHYRVIGRWTPGLGSFTPLTLCGVYVGAQIIKAFSERHQFRKGQLLIVAFISLFLCRIGYGLDSYASPFTFIVAASLFLLFKNLSIAPKLQRIILFISPSMFGVYLLHSTYACFSFMAKESSLFVSLTYCPSLVAYFCVSIFVFVFCLLLTFLIRFGIWGIKSLCLLNIVKMCKKEQI